MARTQGSNGSPEQATASQRQAVTQAEAHARAHMDGPVPISTLCRLVGLSERGLRNAFYRVRGVGPKQWMTAERLRSVQSVLSDAPGRPITVTEIAMDYGFRELGRFAAIYRDAFGEAPSETLRGTARRNAARRHDQR